MPRESKKGYINNALFRDMIIEYNATNVEDDGSWLAGYIERQTKKHDLKRMKDEAYTLSMDFAKRAREKINHCQTNYKNLKGKDKVLYDEHFQQLRADLFIAFRKIAQGRIASLRVKRQLRDIDEIYDITINAVLSMFKYINRYDETRKTSAFSYATQLAHNSIIQQIKAITERNKTLVTGLDYFENLNTLDDPRSVMSGANRLME